MRRITNSTFVSLDGVVNHMERWHFDYIDAETDTLALQQIRRADAMLMGRSTYEAYAAVWPSRNDEYADSINAIAKHVATSGALTTEWSNSTVIDGDLLEAVSELKGRRGQDILMHGYGPVAKTLMAAGLIDELCLWVHPKLAGVGTSDDLLLADGVDTRLDLADVSRHGNGVVVLTYSMHR